MKIKLGLFAAVLLLFLAANITHGEEEPHLVITWQAKSYAPLGYEGKILPTEKSLVNASVALIERGAPVNISNETVYWYLNEKFLAGGQGIRSVQFRTPELGGGSIKLRVHLPGYKGKLIINTIEIPVTFPQLAIDAPFFNKTVGTKFTVRARPFFFNVERVSQLKYSWRVNGAPPKSSENPESLDVSVNADAPPGSQIEIRSVVSNPKADLESAAKSIILYFRP